MKKMSPERLKKYKAYQKEYFKTYIKSPKYKEYHRQYSLKYIKSKKYKDYLEKRSKTEEYKKYHRDYKRKYYQQAINDIRLKYLCRKKTHNLIKHKKLIKQPCIICNSKVVQAHHLDYNKPEVVVWICRKHHEELHKKLKS